MATSTAAVSTLKPSKAPAIRGEVPPHPRREVTPSAGARLQVALRVNQQHLPWVGYYRAMPPLL